MSMKEDALAVLERANALLQLVEMGANVEANEHEVLIVQPTPPEFDTWPTAQQANWCQTSKVGRAKAGDVNDFVRAVGDAHANWKKASNE